MDKERMSPVRDLHRFVLVFWVPTSAFDTTVLLSAAFCVTFTDVFWQLCFCSRVFVPAYLCCLLIQRRCFYEQCWKSEEASTHQSAKTHVETCFFVPCGLRPFDPKIRFQDSSWHIAMSQCDIRSNRPHLCTVCRRCDLILILMVVTFVEYYISYTGPPMWILGPVSKWVSV